MDLDAIRQRFGDELISAEEAEGQLRFEVTPSGIPAFCTFLRDESGFDYPADLTAWDTGEEFVVWYRLYSMADNRTAILRVQLSREQPEVPSVTHIWPGVNWHERECFDLYGIQFKGHPDSGDPQQMRILLPEDWEGHPFRNDYEPVFSGDPLHGPQETN